MFKIDEIQLKDKLIKPGMTVVDLGAAPGGWSQFAVEQVGDKGRVIACDILPMDPIAGVDFLQGDFREEAVLAYRYDGKRYDCGSKLGYLQATVEFGLRHAEVGSAFSHYLKGIQR